MKELILIIQSLILISFIISNYRQFFKEKPHFGKIYTPIDELIGFISNLVLIGITFIIFLFTLTW